MFTHHAARISARPRMNSTLKMLLPTTLLMADVGPAAEHCAQRHGDLGSVSVLKATTVRLTASGEMIVERQRCLDAHQQVGADDQAARPANARAAGSWAAQRRDGWEAAITCGGCCPAAAGCRPDPARSNDRGLAFRRRSSLRFLRRSPYRQGPPASRIDPVTDQRICPGGSVAPDRGSIASAVAVAACGTAAATRRPGPARCRRR